MGIVDESLLLKWSDVFGVGGLVVLILGLAVVLLVVRRPDWFWPLLLIVNTFGNGPRVRGYVILDEIFTGCLVAGAALYLVLRRADKRPERSPTPHRTAFRLWVGYMIAQALVGILETQDLRMLRWVVFYAVVGVLGAIVFGRSRDFPFPDARTASLILVWTSVAYYVVYLGQGIIGAIVLGPYGRFLTQDYYWSGSAYAVLPTMVGTPAAAFLLGDRSRSVRVLAGLALGLMMVVAFYYDSRLSWVFLAVLLAASWRHLHLARLVMLAVLGVVAFAAFTWLVYGRLPTRADRESESIKIVDLSGGDAGRFLHLVAGVHAAESSWRTLLIGQGIYSHRFVLVPFVKEQLRWHLPPQTFGIPGARDDAAPETSIIRTQGAVALLVDTGVLGLGLLLLNAVLLIRSLARKRQVGWLAGVAMVVLAMLWLLTNNTLDIVMLQLLLMPAGFVEQWVSTLAAAHTTRRRVRGRTPHALVAAGAAVS